MVRMRTKKRTAMRRTSLVLAACAALALALTPGLADARAGGGGSFGSRGSMTWSAPPSTNTAPYSGSPMQRSAQRGSDRVNSGDIAIACELLPAAAAK